MNRKSFEQTQAGSQETAQRIQPTAGPSNSTKAILLCLLTRAQVAAELSVCPHSVARYTRQGLLPCVRINRRLIRYRPEDVHAFVQTGTAN